MGNALTADSVSALYRRHAPVREAHRPVVAEQAAPVLVGAPLPGHVLSRREAVLIAVLAVVLHGAMFHAWNAQPEPSLPMTAPIVPPIEIELTRPAPPPVVPQPVVAPPVVPQPVVAPPPPPVDEFAARPAPRKAPPRPKAPPAPAPEPAPIQPPAPVAPAVPAPPALRPPAATPPSANADYLRNPPPEYPEFARRRGWEGTVVLRVHVRATGVPSEIQVQQSSGRDVLDAAATQAVRRWTFVPAKRGDLAEDGWVSVPIGFSLS